MKVNNHQADNFFSIAARMAYDQRNREVVANFVEETMIEGICPYNPEWMANFFQELADIFTGIEDLRVARQNLKKELKEGKKEDGVRDSLRNIDDAPVLEMQEG
jgi:hypothetical protein